MGNIWQHPSVVAMEALTHLEDALIIAPLATKDKTSDFTSRSNGWKVGDTVSFRTHGEYDVKEFSNAGPITTQSISTSTRPMTIEKHLDVSVEVTAREQALDLDSFIDQVIRPATYKLAESVDAYIGTKILQAAGAYYAAQASSASTLFTTAADIALARKAAILQQLSMNRFCLVDLDLEATLLGQPWFNQSQTRGGDGETTLRNADMGRVMGMDFYSSIAFPTESAAYTVGTFVSTLDNGAGGTTNNKIGSSTLTVDVITGALTLVQGDRLKIAGAKRPVIVKTAVADAGSENGTSITTIDLVDPITEVLADGAAVTVLASGKNVIHHGAIFDDRSLAVAFPMLDIPEDRTAATASNNGVSIRIVKGYDLSTKKTTMSLDLLVGAFCLDPRRITLIGDKTA